MPNISPRLLIAQQMASRPVRIATNEQSIGCDFSSANPAAFTVAGNACLSVSVAPSPFGLADLSSSELYFGYRIDDRIAVSAELCGMAGPLYSCLGPKASIKYAITDGFVLGLGAGVSYQRFKDYGSRASGYCDIGSAISIADGISAGISINNIGCDGYNGHGERLYGLISLSYDYSDWLGAAIGSRTELGAVASCYSEIILRPEAGISIGAGIGTEPMLYGVRIGLELSGFTITLRAYSTKDLGWRLSSGIGYTFAK